MHFMLETIVAAHLMGIDAFDQPAVEEGKVLAKKYLAGRDFSPFVPAQARTQCENLRDLRVWLWVPACAGTNGNCSWRSRPIMIRITDTISIDDSEL